MSKNRAESKKLLVTFDPQNPDKSSNDLLVPVYNELGKVELLGTRSGKIIPYGLVILTSRIVTENDLFAKLVETGRRIPDVDGTLALLANFLEVLKGMKIGNVTEIKLDQDRVKMLIAANSPSGFKK